MAISLKGAERRKARVRRAIKARAYGRPRLSVFRSDKNIYAQIIDDATGRTLAAASTLDKDIKCRGQERRDRRGRGCDRQADRRARPRPPMSPKSIFDRGGYLYHGRVKALADAAREGGLQF